MRPALHPAPGFEPGFVAERLDEALALPGPAPVYGLAGLPGSGKSAIARAAAAAIRARGRDVAVVELDEMRRLVTPSPTYSDAERELVYRGLVYVAATLVTAGVPAIIDATGHRRAWRDFARAVLPAFAEVQLLCPLDVCRERERTRAPGHAPVGIYEKAGAAGARVPGLTVLGAVTAAGGIRLQATGAGRTIFELAGTNARATFYWREDNKVATARTDEQARRLLQLMGMPFRQN